MSIEFKRYPARASVRSATQAIENIAILNWRSRLVGVGATYHHAHVLVAPHCHSSVLPVRSQGHRGHSAGPALRQEINALCRPRPAGLGGLHGPGQLGNRHRGRFEIRLRPVVRRAAGQPGGDAAADLVRATRADHAKRPGARLPRALLASRQPLPVARRGTGNRCLRLGRSTRQCAGVAFVVRRVDPCRHRHHGVRHGAGARFARGRIPSCRSHRAGPGADHCQLFRSRAGDVATQLARRGHGPRAQPGAVAATRRAVFGHWHRRRHRHAAQPVPALVDRADPARRRHRCRPARSSALQHLRHHRVIVTGAAGQRGDHDPGSQRLQRKRS